MADRSHGNTGAIRQGLSMLPNTKKKFTCILEDVHIIIVLCEPKAVVKGTVLYCS